MTENRSKAEEAFNKLFGEDASDGQRRRIMAVQEALGIPKTDAMWSVLVVLEFHTQLYEKIPAKIIEALEAGVEQAKHRVRVLIEEARAKAMEGLVDSVKGILPEVSAEVAEREKLKWRTRFLVSLAILLGVLSVTMVGVTKVSFDQGFKAGARADPNVVEWATSPSGTNARALDGRGLLQTITREQLNWMTSLEGQRGYQLARNGTVRELDEKGIEWLLSEKVEWARKIDEAGHLDSDTLDKLNWLAGREGRELYQAATAGALLEFQKRDIIWLVSERGVLSRRMDELGYIRGDTLSKLQWLDTRDGREIYALAQKGNRDQWRGFVETVRSCSNRPGGLRGLLGG